MAVGLFCNEYDSLHKLLGKFGEGSVGHQVPLVWRENDSPTGIDFED